MPTNRIGFSSEFVLVNEQVGIGTTNPTARLDVRGQIRADNSTGGSGVSTVTTYNGFLHSQQNLTTTVSIAQTSRGNLNSLSGEIKITGDLTVTDDTRLTGGRLDSLTVTGSFDLPSSGSVGRELKPEKGSTRFNQDLGQLEFYTGTEWRTTASYDGSGRGRGVFGGGNVEPARIEYINISTTGNSINFGSLLFAGGYRTGSSSSTRGLFSGGYFPGAINSIEYITIASIGNGIDFGDTTVAKYISASCSSSTRSLNSGGFNSVGSSLNVIDYTEISTLGNALDFGDLTISRIGLFSTSSPTRGIFAGGGFPTGIAVIDYATISSVGNAVDFGDLTTQKTLAGGSVSNGIRGVFGSGDCKPGGNNKIIDYITISTTGNSIEFGESTSSKWYASACCNLIRGVWGGGATPSAVNTIDYITIASTGNAQDFGNLSRASRIQNAGLSDSHGGLGGF